MPDLIQETSTLKVVKTIKTLYDYPAILGFISRQGKALYGPGFELYDADRPVVNRLVAYFLQDESVAAGLGINLNKGVLLTGPVGCGKTSLMNLMRFICTDARKHIIKNCDNICLEFAEEGCVTISKYGKHSFLPHSQIARIYCFDDLGAETQSRHWGDASNVMGRILLGRYDLFISNHAITHATTNYTSTDLEGFYGNRVRSRLRAMFNLISFDAGTADKRK